MIWWGILGQSHECQFDCSVSSMTWKQFIPQCCSVGIRRLSRVIDEDAWFTFRKAARNVWLDTFNNIPWLAWATFYHVGYHSVNVPWAEPVIMTSLTWCTCCLSFMIKFAEGLSAQSMYREQWDEHCTEAYWHIYNDREYLFPLLLMQNNPMHNAVIPT